MISGTELKKGVIIDLEDKLYQVVSYQHIKMKRTALVRVKLRDLQGGHTVERTFSSDSKFNQVRLDHSSMQYLYNDGNLYHFMDKETFEQFPLTTEQLEGATSYLKDGLSVEVSSYKGEVVAVEMPITVELEVVETGPGFRGDTATAGTKPARLETGITVQVPMFINNGDILKVDTRDGSYLERLG